MSAGFKEDGTYSAEHRVDPFYRDPEYRLPIRYNSEGHIRSALALLDADPTNPGYATSASVQAQLAVASALQELRAELQSGVGLMRLSLLDIEKSLGGKNE